MFWSGAPFPLGRFYLPVSHLDPLHPSEQSHWLFSIHVPFLHSGVQKSVRYSYNNTGEWGGKGDKGACMHVGIFEASIMNLMTEELK